MVGVEETPEGRAEAALKKKRGEDSEVFVDVFFFVFLKGMLDDVLVCCAVKGLFLGIFLFFFLKFLANPSRSHNGAKVTT